MSGERSALGHPKGCRAGFAGRGMAIVVSTERRMLASAFAPRRSLGAW
jgi:hypothetical protein